MKVTLVQSDITWASPEENIRRNDERLAALQETDIVIFPEMFSTGFITKPEGLAEKEGLTLDWMRTRAKEYGFAIAGSVATEVDGRFYNRFYFVEPSGKVTFYDKRHLFSFGGEDKTFTPGEEKVVIEYGSLRILLQVCYDLRFPETSRNSILPDGTADFDMIIYVASWPSSRVGAWSALLRARAIENQCYVVGVNRVGEDISGIYSGATAAIGPLGKTIVEAVSGEEEVLTFKTDIVFLTDYREKFPALNDIIAP